MTLVEAGAREKSALKLLHDTQRSLEKVRIQIGNRHAALVAGKDSAEQPIPQLYERLWHQLEGLEEEVETMMGREVAQFAVWDAWLRHIKGIGPGLASQLLAMLLPPIPEKSVSSWYKAAGLVPEFIEKDGQWHLPRAREGQDGLSYYPWLRRSLFNVATSFVRNGGYYRERYEKEKERFATQHPEWAPIRVDRVARWRTVRLFLSHLWDAWCEAEGIPAIRKPWVIEYGGHTTIIPKPDPAAYEGKV